MQLARSLFLLLPLLGAGCESNADDFPELGPCEPAPKGYQLTFRDGPDFYVWAVEPTPDSGGSAKAIIYFGTAPNPEGRHSSTLLPGEFAGQSTLWSVWTDENRHSSEAILDYQHDGDSIILSLHSVVTAVDEDDAVALRHWIGSVTFCQRKLTE